MDTAQLKPFNLEAARKGAPFCHKDMLESVRYKWTEKIHTIFGVTQSGRLVMEMKDGSLFSNYRVQELQMLPVKNKMTIVMYRHAIDNSIRACSNEDWQFMQQMAQYRKIAEVDVEYIEEEFGN